MMMYSQEQQEQQQEQQAQEQKEDYKPTAEEERLHQLIKKYGPQETSYCAEFSDADIRKIQKLSEKIHALNKIQRENPISAYFFDQLEKRWNDHKETLIQVNPNETAQVLDVSKTTDIPTIQGLAFCVKLILLTGLAPWRYIVGGSDPRESRAYQQELFAEVGPRADMSVPAQGSVSRVNESLLFTGIFAASFATVTVRESMVSNVASGTGGTSLNRASFPGFAIAHVAGGLGFTLATKINFGAVTTWG
jgi:hypothetical protein